MPNGSFLLRGLNQPTAVEHGFGTLLAVGGVRYDRADKVGKPWPNLPATDKERAGVGGLARKLAKPPVIVERSGADATVARLTVDLPKARWAHLATHGFFAAKGSQERKHLFRPDDFLYGVGMERRGAAARNPLTLSGLVLAGANQPTDADSGVLSGEAVAGLNLDGMDLAVLSACQTGLGEAAAGEGVFGLQRGLSYRRRPQCDRQLVEGGRRRDGGVNEPFLLSFVGERRDAVEGVASSPTGVVSKSATHAGVGAWP